LKTIAILCLLGVQIANEILMHFRGQKKTLGDVSLSDYIETGSDGSTLSFMDVICSQEDLAEQYTERETVEKLHRAVGLALDQREAQIIALRYGFGNRDPLTQHEVADLMGISRSYVSRIEKKALQKLREFMKD